MKRWRSDQAWSSSDEIRSALQGPVTASLDDNDDCGDEQDTARFPELAERISSAAAQLKETVETVAAAVGSGADGDMDFSEKETVREYKEAILNWSAAAAIDDDDGADHAEEPPAVPWRPQNQQSTVDFTHIIEDYAHKRESGCKKAEYSSVTVDEYGNRWRLIVYVNGNGRASNHHLSLFLQVADADDLPFGWKKAVSYVLTLEHPAGTSVSYAKRNPDKTFKLCPKAIDWGWSQFITSDRIQQEGFVVDDSLSVRASVTVKSSSVSIDEEDSELYLKCAVEEGDADAVRLCLDHGAKVNCKFKDDLYTPLHTACSSGTNTGSMEVLNLLLEKDADGNACNKWQETPLLIAANNGHRAAVEALLKHGANPSLSSEAGWSALTFASHKGFDDIVALLLRAGAPVNCEVTEDSSTPLHKACAGSKPGHLSSVKLLITGGADVHALNKWRETPLLTAANHGQAGAVEALLRAGADPCKCTDTGWSPLSIAAYKGHDDVVRLLLEEGAPTEEDDPTLSALLQAATKGLPDTVELLLQHGADHTVTTKKGDTALSILVEQNLIDAAVELVSDYNASIPRCSRDRRKVQRARLLINLRMKQIEKEGKNKSVSTDDGDHDDDDSDDEMPSLATASAQHGARGGNGSSKKGKKGRNKKKSNPNLTSAEEMARAAEESLLMELEKEDAKAKKEEAEANTKRAKKKKKKERERQQKLKEEAEKREQKEKEQKERERLRKEKEEKEQKEREQKEKEQRAREMKEQEKMLAAKRKEREERERKGLEQQRGQKLRNKEAAVNGSPASSHSSANRQHVRPEKNGKKVNGTTSATLPSLATQDSRKSNRRWETSETVVTPQNPVLKTSVPGVTHSDGYPDLKSSIPPSTPQPQASSAMLSPRVAEIPVASDQSTFIDIDHRQSSNTMTEQELRPPENVINPLGSIQSIEHPSLALYRQDKVVELVKQCFRALPAGNESIVKQAMARWVARNAQGISAALDPIIPSWTEDEQLVTFFQRQLITECRRSNSFAASQNIEFLREAGASIARCCQNVVNEVVQVGQQAQYQLPSDWSDASLGMSLGSSGSAVTITWANRAQVEISASTIGFLRDRYSGRSDRILTALFVTKTWYDTEHQIFLGTDFGKKLPLSAQSCLASELQVSAELFVSPFDVYGKSVFWGRLAGVDGIFGGQAPFGHSASSSVELLARHGGSVSVLLPPDTIVASRCIQRMVDVLDASSALQVPLSFAIFIEASSFPGTPTTLSSSNVLELDPRLGEANRFYQTRTEFLRHGTYVFPSVGDEIAASSQASLFVLLQNDPGKESFGVSDIAWSKILASLGPHQSQLNAQDLGLTLPVGFPPDEPVVFPSDESQAPPVDFFPSLSVTSTMSQHQPLSSGNGYDAFGGSILSNGFSPAKDAFPRGSRRLFELVDDVEDDPVGDVDIVSGMLNSLDLDVGLFQNTNIGSEVDIEAISLMGIGAPTTRQSQERTNARRFG